MEAAAARSVAAPELLRRAAEELRALLPSYLTLTGRPGDAGWDLRARSGGSATIEVLVRGSFVPRDAQLLRAPPDATLLVVSRWLSPRSRELLTRRNLSYVDLAGNISLRTSQPAVFLRLQGEARDPRPRPQRAATLQGPKAQRLARLLIDFTPPYRLKDLVAAGDLSEGYISRLLEALQEQAFVDRPPRGAVEHVDWQALLQAAAAPVRAGVVGSFVAPAGAAALYRRLAEGVTSKVVVTGSFAAAAVAPVAAPSQLMLYVSDPGEIQSLGRLLPADRGADVFLLRDGEATATARTRQVDGLEHVALSQLVMDCANGPGRLPEEGAAVLAWMQANEPAWRRSIS